MIDIKSPRLVTLYGVKDGNINYVCSCGRLASAPLKEYNRQTRCHVCTEANSRLTRFDKLVTSKDKKELFIALLNNGLYTFVNNISNSGKQ